jgi:hypothetical protein
MRHGHNLPMHEKVEEKSKPHFQDFLKWNGLECIADVFLF